ncbi:sphinganine kinase lcb4 [Agyrium rufum]|nr:sphinganine kinase lcb4 [Agyrium rufum]
MASQDLVESDPFVDPSLRGSTDQQGSTSDESTLVVGRNASLTLGTDALIVLDEGFSQDQSSRCCGLIPSRPKTTKAIPFFNVLWAELSDYDIIIHYARPTSNNIVRPAHIQYPIEKSGRSRATNWVSRLLDRAYRTSQRNKKIKVLVNPYGGNGGAQKAFDRDVQPIFAAARCELSVERTKFQGHAVEIAEKLDIDAFHVIASCSGDGLPHEVFNGLGKKPDARRALSKIAVVQLPCGTGNAMSWNTNGTDSNSLAALCIVKGIRTPIDLVSVTQGDTRTLSFLSQSVGIVAESDLGTEHLRFLGSARFTYGFLVRLLGKTVYPCDLAVHVEMGNKADIKEHHRKHRKTIKKMDKSKDGRYRDGDDDSTHSANDSTPNTSEEDSSQGLPSLRFGTIKDPLPDSWSLNPYDKLGNFYAGNMALMAPALPFFPAALPSDGYLDLVTIDGDIPRLAALQSLLAVEKGTFFDMPHVNYRKITGYRIVPRGQKTGYISIDGERVPFAPFQAEVHSGLGTTLSRRGPIYEGLPGEWGEE